MIPGWSKRLIHRHIMSDHTLHEWQLNLYLAIERAPAMVLDYIPVDEVEDGRLRRDFLRHRAEERKHELLFLRALKRIGGRDLSFPYEATYNRAVDQAGCHHGHRPFRDGIEDMTRWLLHIHVIEQRGLASFLYKAEACRHAGLEEVSRDIEGILADEERHVGYTREALRDLLGPARAEKRLREALRIESRAHVAYSRRFVEEFLRIGPSHGNQAWKVLYRLGVGYLNLHERLRLDRWL